jgi:hypothetical protein
MNMIMKTLKNYDNYVVDPSAEEVTTLTHHKRKR